VLVVREEAEAGQCVAVEEAREVLQEAEAASALVEEVVPEVGASHEVAVAASLLEAEEVLEEDLPVGVDNWTACTPYPHVLQALSVSFVWFSSFQGRLQGYKSKEYFLETQLPLLVTNPATLTAAVF
jgi:hypothetical protein